MDKHHADIRKIDPTKGKRLVDGSPNDDNRMEIGPTKLALDEWETAGLTLPNLDRLREHRWKKLTKAVAVRDYGAILLFDPLNIRYATDSTNMQLWNTHNLFRAVLLCADGYMVLWDYKASLFLADHLPLVRETRTGAAFYYYAAGNNGAMRASKFAAEVDELIREHGGGNKRLAIDKIMLHGLRAFEKLGYDVLDGEEVTEKTRAVKSIDEINAMRCAIHSTELAMSAMHDATEPGMSEDDIWAVLHAENIRRGGEWIETRLLASGPRTNPWMQECGQRILQNNEVLAFDTDLIGPYGMCCDISRTWWFGDQSPRPDMVYAMNHALEHLQSNIDMLKPGISIRELSFSGHELDAQFLKQKYGTKMHGVGLCDEWPSMPYADRWEEGAYDQELEPGMVFCAESLVSPEDGDFSIKLEDQVLITESGYENLTTFPFDERLLGKTP